MGQSRKIHEQGVNHFRKGNFAAALEKLNEALQQPDDPKHAAEIYNDMGATYRQLEDYPAAHQALNEAMDRFIALADEKGQAQVLGNRASVFEAEERVDEAIDTYKQSAAMLENVGEGDMAMYVWQAVSKLRLKQKQYIAAIGAYEEGVENMPQGSLKKKLLGGLLRMPGSLLGGPPAASNDEENNEE